MLPLNSRSSCLQLPSPLIISVCRHTQLIHFDHPKWPIDPILIQFNKYWQKICTWSNIEYIIQFNKCWQKTSAPGWRALHLHVTTFPAKKHGSSEGLVLTGLIVADTLPPFLCIYLKFWFYKFLEGVIASALMCKRRDSGRHFSEEQIWGARNKMKGAFLEPIILLLGF